MKNMIQVEHLVKTFKEAEAVRDISLEVPEGQIFGFLGPNGAGKTTTINILTTLMQPTSGKALLNGHDVVKERDEARKSFGIVFQDPSLDTMLTAYDNLKFHGMLYNIPGDLLEKRIHEVLALVELADRAHSKVKPFSGGMKRRLEIARGLIHYPKILFLDEPTIGLDPQSRRGLWRYILELKKKENMTIFMTTHYMEEAEFCDRIAIIDQGKIIALGTPGELKASIGGEILELATADNENASREIKDLFGIESRQEANLLTLEVEKGEQFLPQLLQKVKTPILSISLRKPSLDDVFLRLTGTHYRDEENPVPNRRRKR